MDRRTHKFTPVWPSFRSLAHPPALLPSRSHARVEPPLRRSVPVERPRRPPRARFGEPAFSYPAEAYETIKPAPTDLDRVSAPSHPDALPARVCGGLRRHEG